MLILEKNLGKYYKELYRHLLCSKSLKQNFITETKKRVNDFIEENSDANFEDIIDFLGTPESLATFYLDILDPIELETHRRKLSTMKFLRNVSAISTILFFGFLIFYIGNARLGVEITEEITTEIFSEQEYEKE